jgi:predicted RND superfamily exporter protein
MTGIIINDSIVLITTVDDYARDRGLVPAIVDAVADRLRPVLLTTLTTVLGLAPLLYERSADAQFLKPTVITLVYGLGFGLFIVLLVVPSILAMQQDVSRQMQSLRRGLRTAARAPAMAAGVGLAVLAVAAGFAATLGAFVVTGQVWGPLAGLEPLEGARGALFGFVVAAAAICLTLWLSGLAIAGIMAVRHRARVRS